MQVTGNHNGNVLEEQIASLLKSKGYVQLMAKQVDGQTVPFFVRQYRGFETLYGSKMRSDFFLKHPRKWPEGLVLECKWQQTPGSVDEKFPYVVWSMERIPVPSALLLAGGGYGEKALKWVQAQGGKKVCVLEGLDRIVKWAHAQL